MMSSYTLEEVIVIRFTLVRDKPADFFEAKMKSQSTSTCGTIYNAFDFYSRVTFRERFYRPRGSKLYFTEWIIKIGDEKHFKLANTMYDYLMIILGVESFYWQYISKSTRTKQGMVEYKVEEKICGCCVDECYLEILEMVKKFRTEIQYVKPRYFLFYNPEEETAE